MKTHQHKKKTINKLHSDVLLITVFHAPYYTHVTHDQCADSSVFKTACLLFSLMLSLRQLKNCLFFKLNSFSETCCLCVTNTAFTQRSVWCTREHKLTQELLFSTNKPLKAQICTVVPSEFQDPL